MKKRLSEGVFPPCDWEKSSYRFLKLQLYDGSKVDFDFWRECVHVEIPSQGKPLTFGARLQRKKGIEALTAKVWLVKTQDLSTDLLQRINRILKTALSKAGYIPDIKVSKGGRV